MSKVRVSLSLSTSVPASGAVSAEAHALAGAGWVRGSSRPDLRGPEGPLQPEPLHAHQRRRGGELQLRAEGQSAGEGEEVLSLQAREGDREPD